MQRTRERGRRGLSGHEAGSPCHVARQRVSQGTMALEAMASQPTDSKPLGLLAQRILWMHNGVEASLDNTEVC